jgi:AraC family transcriptional regulator
VPLDIELKPYESLLFRGDVVAGGTFRCPSTYPLFRNTGPCSYHTFVFPRTTTHIDFEDGRSFTGSPRGVAFYNQHQLYRRTKISEMDSCDWMTVADDVLLELMLEHDPRATPERPFNLVETVCDADVFLAQRQMFDALAARCLDDVEEAALLILRRVVARAFGAPRRKPPRDRDAVEHVRALIAADPSRSLSLRTLAAQANVSPFRLCRSFREQTGETMTEYRHSVRLRLALDRLKDRRVDLTALALDLGYSSHSHFTYAFRTRFGMTPSAYRATA